MVSLLLDCHDLAARLASSTPPIVLDVRWSLGGPPGVGDYRIGHIPGAQFVDLDLELSAPPGPGRHPLPSAADFEAAMRRHGVSGTRPVIAYDASTGTSAARAWWLLRYFGHPDVAVLDGGFAAWTAAGLPVAAGDEPAGCCRGLPCHPRRHAGARCNRSGGDGVARNPCRRQSGRALSR
jgi:thiosulfate/3-mercaptopyruvate sulfurtransferase